MRHYTEGGWTPSVRVSFFTITDRATELTPLSGSSTAAARSDPNTGPLPKGAPARYR